MPLKVKYKKWRAIASWNWNVDDEFCSICHQPFNGCCPDCKFPGDGCPPVWGKCEHSFHIHCILKWLKSQNNAQQCPLCRADWEFK